MYAGPPHEGSAPSSVSWPVTLQGISKHASTTTYADGEDIPATVALVEAADAAVLVVGLRSEGVKPNDGAT